MTSLVDRREVEKLLVLSAALQAGLIDALTGADDLSAEEVAAAVAGDARACGVMLAALETIGVVGEEGGRYHLTELGYSHLVEPPPGEPLSPDLERSSLLHQARKFEGWLRLPAIISSGRPPEKDPVSRDIRTFVRTMGEGDSVVVTEVIERVLAYAGVVPGGTVLDVGGAVGHVALAFAERGLAATLFDRPAVLPEARAFLGPAAGAISMEAGDFTLGLPKGPFGLAYLGNIAHIYGPATNAALVRRVYSILAPGGTIAIRDFVWERSPRAAMFAVNMLQATQEGGVWREAEYTAWLREAGFDDVRIVDLELSQNQLILGRRA